MTLAVQEDFLEFLRERSSATLILDLQEDHISGNEDRILALLSLTNISMPSADEVRRLLGTDNWMEAARLFASLGPFLVVIKLGNKGCLLYDSKRDRPFSVKNVLDTTGAGTVPAVDSSPPSTKAGTTWWEPPGLDLFSHSSQFRIMERMTSLPRPQRRQDGSCRTGTPGQDGLGRARTWPARSRDVSRSYPSSS